jgi:Superfamily II DNA/RNA helicases, SNF2 family
MSEKLVITLLHEHKTLGTLVHPYVAQALSSIAMQLLEPLTPECANKYPELVSPEINKLISYSDKYSEHALFNLFNKDKKGKLKEFIENVDDEIVSKSIRPYIEKNQSKVLALIKQTVTPLFVKDSFDQTVSTACRIHISETEYNPHFHFIRNENGFQYTLQIKSAKGTLDILHSKATILCIFPCWLQINREIYHINGIEANKLKPFLKSPHVSIPKHFEEAYFKGFIAEIIRRFETSAEGVTIENRQPEPHPILVLTRTLDFRLAFELQFSYNGLLVKSTDGQSVFVKTEIQDNEFKAIKIKRNQDVESQWKAKLESNEFIQHKNGLFSLALDEDNDALQETYHTINWLNFNKEYIRTIGFNLDEQILKDEFFTNNIDLIIETGEKTDWFDVNIKVRFGEFLIPFSKLRNNLKEGNREYILPDKRIAIIPEEWFARFRDLVELGKVNQEGNFELPKFHFNLIEQISGVKQYDSSLLFTENKLGSLPLVLKAQLRPYQEIGFQWMYQLQQNSFGGILADDMGLGKTLQTITLIAKLREEEYPASNLQQDAQLDIFAPPPVIVKPILIIMPLSLLFNWEREIRKFAPTLQVRNLTNETAWRNHGVPLFTDIAIISYGTMRNYADKLAKTEFRCLILDESQNIKNPTSKAYQAVMKLKGDFRLSISGTPIENRLADLWAQFNFINPGLLGNYTYFKREFASPIEKGDQTGKQERLQKLIQPFLLRRTKEMVVPDLPELTQQTIFCDMSQSQRSLYETEKSRIRNWVMDNISRVGVKRSSIIILKAIHTLRLMANHPALSHPDYKDDSGKSNIIFEYLSDIVEQGHKVLIFSSYVRHLHLVEQYLKQTGIDYEKLTGSLKQKERMEAVARFQKDTTKSVFLISLKAGGTGLNLTAADYIFILDPWWNPAAETQALNRAHRIGQDKKVFVYRFITRQTIEEKIQQLQEKKCELSALIQSTDNPLSQLKAEELSALLE